MAKAIILCRVSTTKQEIEAQISETKAFALADGWKEKDLVIFAKQGASAFKLDAEYRENMQRVYDEIEKGGVECVYAWAVDRIGRNERALMDFKDYLIGHRVQLKIKSNGLVLLNPDGSVNTGVELAFSIFSTMAKQEVAVRSQRIRRTIEARREKGQHYGAKVLFGYTLDAAGYMVRNEQTAPLVEEAFARYATGDYSVERLADTMRYNGWSDCTESNLSKVLTNTAYIGEHTRMEFDTAEGRKTNHRKVEGYKCPPIISKEVWDRCRKVARQKATRLGNTELHWLGARKIVCPDCGRHYVVWKSAVNTGVYRCVTHGKGLKDEQGKRLCDNDVSVNAYRMDALLWYVARPLELKRARSKEAFDKAKIEKEIARLTKEKDLREKEYKGRVSHQIERVKDLYQEGIIAKDEFKQRLAEAKAKSADKEAEIERLKLTIAAKKRMLDADADYNEAMVTEAALGYGTFITAEVAQSIVDRNIEQVTLERAADGAVLITMQTVGGVQRFACYRQVRTFTFYKLGRNDAKTEIKLPILERVYVDNETLHEWQVAFHRHNAKEPIEYSPVSAEPLEFLD